MLISEPPKNNPSYLSFLGTSIFIMVILFMISAFSGYLSVILYNVTMLESLKEAFEAVTSAELNPLFLLAFIFVNNALKTLLAMLTGIGLGIIPVLFIIANGFILGVVAAEVSGQYGPLFMFAAILPHGIFELPAVIIGSAIGLRLGITLIRKLQGKGGVKNELGRALKFYSKRLLLILFIAAVIETFITPLIVFIFL